MPEYNGIYPHVLLAPAARQEPGVETRSRSANTQLLLLLQRLIGPLAHWLLLRWLLHTVIGGKRDGRTDAHVWLVSIACSDPEFISCSNQHARLAGRTTRSNPTPVFHNPASQFRNTSSFICLFLHLSPKRLRSSAVAHLYSGVHGSPAFRRKGKHQNTYHWVII